MKQKRKGIQEDANGNEKLLEDAARQEEDTNKLIMTEDSIEIAHHMKHCEDCGQGGIEGAKNLMSLVGCNLYDEHQEQVQEESSPAISM